MHKISSHLRPAFTMLELVFVMTILGIVASIGSEIISQVYESYVLQRATHRSSVKTELAATQLANRLAYAIPNTVIGRKSTGYTDITDLDAADYPILEWVGYDNDSFAATAKPGWSGFADIDASTATKLSTPGSKLGRTNKVIKHLGGSGLNDAALFFPDTYDIYNIGYNGNTSGIVRVTGKTGADKLNVNMTGKTIKEQYKLAWSAYAVVASSDSNGTYDLDLYYNYQPWKGESYTNGTKQPLLKKVSVFKFTGSGNTIRFKICQQERIGESVISTCKEKAVIR